MDRIRLAESALQNQKYPVRGFGWRHNNSISHLDLATSCASAASGLNRWPPIISGAHHQHHHLPKHQLRHSRSLEYNHIDRCKDGLDQTDYYWHLNGAVDDGDFIYPYHDDDRNEHNYAQEIEDRDNEQGNNYDLEEDDNDNCHANNRKRHFVHGLDIDDDIDNDDADSANDPDNHNSQLESYEATPSSTTTLKYVSERQQQSYRNHKGTLYHHQTAQSAHYHHHHHPKKSSYYSDFNYGK